MGRGQSPRPIYIRPFSYRWLLFSGPSMLTFWQNISNAGFCWRPAIIMIRKGIFGLARFTDR
jgi:hypothetical protein